MNRVPLLKQLIEVRPQQIEAYLVAMSWRRDGNLGTRASIWHRPEDRFFDQEVLLPIGNGLKDFDDRMADAILAIASFEKRGPNEIMKAVMGVFADQISIRVFHHDTKEGTIPLEDGILLNIKARDLIATSAMSTLSKQKQFSGKRPAEASEFLKSLKLGQTEIGSYVVNVIAPVGLPLSHQESIATTSMTRMVTANLASSLEALASAIEEFKQADDLTVFDKAVTNGASSNMCDALIGLSGEKKSRGFEIAITPSSSDSFKSDSKTFIFSAETISFISVAAEYFKDDYVILDRTFTGFIKRLDRPAQQENGTITIEATVATIEKLIMVELTPADYALAIEAHQAKDVVSCHGNLHVKARTARLLEPAAFRVLRSRDLF